MDSLPRCKDTQYILKDSKYRGKNQKFERTAVVGGRFLGLSRNIQVLSLNEGALCERECPSAEKTPFFDIFRKALTDKRLHGYLFVNGRFTKSEFAKGKVSLRERYRFVVPKDMFEATKHGLWRGQSLGMRVRNLSFRKIKNKE